MDHGYQRAATGRGRRATAPPERVARRLFTVRSGALSRQAPSGQARCAGAWARLTSYTPATLRMARIRPGSRPASGSSTV